MGKYILVALIGYFMGNIATSYFVGKASKGIDIRQHGSGNAGATNTFRVLGLKAGLTVFVFDVLKGVLAALIGGWITGSKTGLVVAGASAVLGHNWPVLFNFKGGKGIATSFGLMLAAFPLIGGILFCVEVLIIAFTRYVSLASIVAAILFPVLLIVFRQPTEILVIGMILSLVALYRHKTNFSRLLAGKENKIEFGSKKG